MPQECTGLKETNCPNVKCKKHKRRLGIADVHHMFANAQECNVSMVYVDSHDDGTVVHTLKVKRVADDCHVFFTARGPSSVSASLGAATPNYYYFYNSLLHRLILWSRHPHAFGKEGYNGSHTTIGFNSHTNRWDIHDTRYHSKNSTVGTFRIIAPEKTERQYYPLDTQLFLPQEAPAPVQWLWDQLWCKDNAQAGGADEAYTKLLKTTPQKIKAAMSVAEMKKRCQPIYKANQVGAARFTYVPKHKMVEAADALKRQGFNQVLITHHASRSTFVWIQPI